MAIRVSLASVLVLIVLISIYSLAQMPSVAFHGVEEWKESLTASGISSLGDLYSKDPPARFRARGQKPVSDISPETDFWQKLISSGMTHFDVVQLDSEERRGLHLVSLAVSMETKTPDGPRTRYVTEEQAWQQQGDKWRIVIAAHTDVVKMPPALHPNPNLYDTNANANGDIEEAIARAKKEHQRVILVFGANWCYDCHVLDQAFHQNDVAKILQNFQVVHIDIGDDGKKNGTVAAEYQVPVEKGIPALAVVDADGKLLYSQKNGEWEAARSLDPDDLIAFLNTWK